MRERHRPLVAVGTAEHTLRNSPEEKPLHRRSSLRPRVDEIGGLLLRDGADDGRIESVDDRIIERAPANG